MDESGVLNKKRNILIPNLSVRSSSVNAMDHVDVDVGESFSKCEKLKKDEKQTNKPRSHDFKRAADGTQIILNVTESYQTSFSPALSLLLYY